MVWNAKKSFTVEVETEQKFPGGKYAMVITAGKRAHDLQKGATPLIPGLESHKPTVVALMEIDAGLITSDYPDDHVEPKTKEEEVQFNGQ
jgi:DNA-directed RNA polymerase omega subunit